MYYHYIIEKVSAILHSEASKYYLSYFWWVLEPLLLLAVYYIVFGLLFERGGKGFITELMIGITVWGWFASSISASMSAILESKGLINQVYAPKFIFPVIKITVCSFKQILAFLLLFVFLLSLEQPSFYWLHFLPLMAIQLIVISGVGVLLAGLIPFLPDLKMLVQLGITMMMFLSGVFYTIERVPVEYREYFLYNPMANLIHQYRLILIHHQTPDYWSLSIIVLIFSMLLWLGVRMIRKFDRLYPRIV